MNAMECQNIFFVNIFIQGWKMAMYEMKILAAYILRHFEISTSQGQDDIKLQFHIVLSMEKNVNFILKKRQ